MINWSLEAPFDLRTLEIFRAVAECRSFTRAGERLGLTQSAVTRQIQALEENLDLRLFERTTRQVRTTAAGEHLLAASADWLRGVEDALVDLQVRFGAAARRIRVGVSQSIGFAYLPGFFTSYRKSQPSIQIEVSYARGGQVMEDLGAARTEIGVCAAPARLPRALEVTHRFDDRFVAIVPPDWPDDAAGGLLSRPMVLFSAPGATRSILETWCEELPETPMVAMHAESFDLVVNLVSLGIGWSAVPQRSLAMYGRRKPVRRLAAAVTGLEEPRREIVVIARRDRARPRHVAEFIERILF